jgi:hypothetical protein
LKNPRTQYIHIKKSVSDLGSEASTLRNDFGSEASTLRNDFSSEALTLRNDFGSKASTLRNDFAMEAVSLPQDTDATTCGQEEKKRSLDLHQAPALCIYIMKLKAGYKMPML